MHFIGDFHIHSHYSLATSKELRPEFLDLYGRIKGIGVAGTGDCTHPGWLAELKEKLEPAGPGLFTLRPEYRKELPVPVNEPVRFILTTEISNIYKKNGKVRKVHNVVFVPGFEAAEKIQTELEKRKFNIRSDGRPILGLDSRNLLELCLEASEEIFFVPAHIWTPWFSVLGSKSGFDSVEECFGDLSHHITAVETGLSTDPPMNWLCSFLDRFTLTANSDAHSPEKLGRNANLFETDMNYPSIIDAMRTGDPGKFKGTVDFFPQEGKYHYDGHRKCGVVWDPLETLEHKGICPVCGKKVTVGVMNRIAQLADRSDPVTRPNRHPFHSLIPLKELLAEIHQCGPSSKKIGNAYMHLIRKAGSEFEILLHRSVQEIEAMAGSLLAEAVRRMRNREVYIKEGFDGEYGRIRVFRDEELKTVRNQSWLFGEMQQQYGNPPRPLIPFDVEKFQRLNERQEEFAAIEPVQQAPDLFSQEPPPSGDLNTMQRKAVRHGKGPAIVIAGPGTGKTRALTERIISLIRDRKADPGKIMAVTFTNKAAEEMLHRLSAKITADQKPWVGTFHAFGYSFLKENLEFTGRSDPFLILDRDERIRILKRTGIDNKKLHEEADRIGRIKEMVEEPAEEDKVFVKYQQELTAMNAFALEDLLYRTVGILTGQPEVLDRYRKRIEWLLVDEYQDINPVQYRLVRLLMPPETGNLFVIGDPDQAIYGFRGSDVRFIEKFREDYRNAVLYRLDRSYRCSDTILSASAGVVGGLNPEGRLLQGMHAGLKLKISVQPSEKAEAEYIARTIEKMMGGTDLFSMYSGVSDGEQAAGGSGLSDFAVFCRISKLMPPVEKALNDHHIPYQKAGEEDLFRKEPAGTALDILRYAAHAGHPFFGELIGKYPGLKGLVQSGHFRSATVSAKIDLIIGHCFSHREREKHAGLFDKLLNEAASFGSNPEGFLKHIALRSGVDGWKREKEAVSLMTLHAGKGLEFETVFIAGCEDGLLPYGLHDRRSDPAEERRLLYVGMTRAKSHLYLTHAQRRFLFGRELRLPRSPFLDNIEKELLEVEETGYRKKEKKPDGQIRLFE